MIGPIAAAVAVGFLGWIYKSVKPPSPKICGSPGGPPVTSPRIKLSDGRHLAYRETGVPKQHAIHKIIFVHGFYDSKDFILPVSQELLEELKIYIIQFDRAGYGESDPFPGRSVKSEAYDIQELADNLQIGSKFYVIGASMGAYPVWSCLKYIPHRLSGASLVVPFVNYWWRSTPSNLAKQTFKKLLVQDQWVFRVAHHTPWLLNWWMTQKWFPVLSMISGNMSAFSDYDLAVLKKLSEQSGCKQDESTKQGVHESLHRDLIAGYGKWEFHPTEIPNPFPNNEGSVHIWQGLDDKVIPFEMNRYISEKLPWIKYHELPDTGHFLISDASICGAVFRELLNK